MIERLCAMCGGVWAKSYNFCPSDGTALVAIDAVVSASLAPPRAEARKPAPTADYGAAAAQEAGKRTPRAADWLSPVYTRLKSHEARAFVETACQPRPQSGHAAEAAPADDETGRAAHAVVSPTRRSRLKLRANGERTR